MKKVDEAGAPYRRWYRQKAVSAYLTRRNSRKYYGEQRKHRTTIAYGEFKWDLFFDVSRVKCIR